MSWRYTQLGTDSCDQDSLILSLFVNQKVKYVGSDQEFCQKLSIDPSASNLILVMNQPLWVSEIRSIVQENLSPIIKTFYIGINRYQVVGNDTNTNFEIIGKRGQDILNMLTFYVNQCGFNVLKTGTFDQDHGRYFNFVQPLTWMYGTNEADSHHR